MKGIEEDSVFCPFPAVAVSVYVPLAMGKFGTANVRLAVPLLFTMALPRFSSVVVPDTQEKLTCVPVG